MRRLMDYLSIRKKLVIIYGPITILTMLVCCFSFVNVIEKRTIKEFGTSKIISLKHIADKNENMIENMIYISNSYLCNQEIADYIGMKGDDSDYEKSRMFDLARKSLIDNENIFYNITFYTTFLGINNNYISTSTKANLDSDTKRVDFLKEIIGENKTSLVWSPVYNYQGENIISAIRYMMDVRTGEQIGIMIFDFPETVFSSAYDRYLDSEERVEIISGDGRMVSSSQKDMLGQNRKDTSLFQELHGYKEGYFYSEKENSIDVFIKIDKINWYIVSSTHLPVVLAPFHDVQQKLFMIVGVVSMTVFILTIVAARYISGPLVRLAEEIKGYRGGKEDSDAKFSQNEVHYLSHEYQKMTERIEQLIHQIFWEQEAKRVSEIEALQAQINPHFLYNTLQSIRILNRSGEKEEIDKVIVTLVRLLSELLSKKEHSHTVKDEIQFLEDYIYIQQVRYGHNFRVFFECSFEIELWMIPKLIIQPIVENAIFHGLSEYETGGEIHIRMERQDEAIKITVLDNGVGFCEEDLKEKSFTPIAKKGIAIGNIKNRLNLLYGKQADIEITSQKGLGTKVTVIIPKKEVEKDEGNNC